MPFNVNNFYTGREERLSLLRQLLIDSKKAAITGLGGMGKTQFALITFSILLFVLLVALSNYFMNRGEQLRNDQQASINSQNELSNINMEDNREAILLSMFDGPDENSYGVNRILREKIETIVNNNADLRFKKIDDKIDSSQRAKEIGQANHARIIIWGNYIVNDKKARITVHFEVPNKPQYLALLNNKKTISPTAEEFKSFTVTETLADEMNFLSLLTVGLLKYEAKDYDKAIEKFKEAINLSANPKELVNLGDIYFYCGSAYLFKNDFQESIYYLTKATGVNPNDAVAYGNLAHAYWYVGEYDQAIKELNNAIKTRDDYVEGYLNRAGFHLLKSEYTEAIDDCNKALIAFNQWVERDNNNIIYYPYMCRVYKLKADVYTEQGLYEQALVNYNKAIELQPSNVTFCVDSYINRGRVFRLQKKFDRAFEDYNEAIATVNESLEALENEPSTLFTKEALKASGAIAYSNRGYTYALKQQYEKAIIDCNRAVELDPDNPNILYDRGYVFFKRNEYGLAITDYKNALQTKYTGALTLFNRSETLVTSKDLIKSIIVESTS